MTDMDGDRQPGWRRGHPLFNYQRGSSLTILIATTALTVALVAAVWLLIATLFYGRAITSGLMSDSLQFSLMFTLLFPLGQLLTIAVGMSVLFLIRRYARS